MAKKRSPECRVTTPEARLSYPALFEPKGFQNSDADLRYQCELIFDSDADMSKLKLACATALCDQFPDSNNRPKVKLPILSGDEVNQKRISEGREPKPEIEGKWLIRARSKQKPAVVDENVQPVIQPDKVYAGCRVYASVTAYWFDMGANRGLSFALNGIQFVRDDEPFGQQFDVNEAFGPLQTTSAATAGGEGGAIDAMFE